MWLQVFLSAVFVGFALGEGDGTARRTAQVPFVADAVGNSLPPPAELPAKVGSPSNLLTPDRYEFYTFDESGELVKRLMTLEEIQAIVAAGEGNDGHMVTFAQDEKPTIAFNFSQPPFTKVHSVVTNVQNVLKSQMEAQKNNPSKPISFDTPDVSNSWSMILPSIFGNTGVDIVPDKLSSNFGTPETETVETENKLIISDLNSDTNALSKEETEEEFIENFTDTSIESKEQNDPSSLGTLSITSTSTTTSTIKPKIEPLITTVKRSNLPSFTTTTTIKPTTTTAKKPPSTTLLTTIITTTTPISTTVTLPQTFITTEQAIKSKEEIHLPDYEKFEKISSSHQNVISESKKEESSTKQTVNKSDHFFDNSFSMTTETNFIEVSKSKTTINPFTTPKPSITLQIITSKPTITQSNTNSSNILNSTFESTVSPTTYRPSSTSENFRTTVTLPKFTETKKVNGTTLTTQSVSPSTTQATTNVIATEIVLEKKEIAENKDQILTNNQIALQKNDEEIIPAFDVAQSISQIASDLGNGFAIQSNNEAFEAEMKENGEIDLTDISANDTSEKEALNSTFVQVSINDSQDIKQGQQSMNHQYTNITSTEKVYTKFTGSTEITTRTDPVMYLPDSMSDLITQAVNNSSNSIFQTTSVKNVPMSSTERTLVGQNNAKDVTKNIIEVLPNSSSNNLNFISGDLNQKKDNSTPTESFRKNHTSSHENNFVKVVTLNTSTSPGFSEPSFVTERIFTNDTKITTSTQKKDIQIENVENPTQNESSSKIKPAQIQISKPHENDQVEKENKTLTSSKGAPLNENEIISKNNASIMSNKQNHTDVFKISSALNNSESKLQQRVNETKKKIQKVNFEEKEFAEPTKNDSWKLVSTVSPPKSNVVPISSKPQSAHVPPVQEIANDPSKEINLEGSNENQGLEITTKNLSEDVYQFTELCNELAFRYWSAAVANIDQKRSFVLSPYSITSMLAMIFMGARGATSGEMNDILKLDDMVTFNPHFTLKNISDSIETTPSSGIAVAAFVRELYSDRNRGKLLSFYKERAQHFYSGHVEEINFKLINDIIRRRTNLLVKRYTWGKINEYIKTNDISMKPPLAAFSANIFETDCTGSSVEGRDGEMYFVVSPSVRQRRLVPVPAALYRGGFLAGYHAGLDATAAALGSVTAPVSTVLLMPGQQGGTVHADDLERLERRMLAAPAAPEWRRLLRSLSPRPGLELQIPRFAHRSVVDVAAALRRMGLRDLFDAERANLGGLAGPSGDLHLSAAVEASEFATCGESGIGAQHHTEEYPAAGESVEEDRRRRGARTSDWEEPRDYQRAFHDPHDVGAALPLHLRPRQARLPARAVPHPARLKFDRPFLYFVRHNPTGMILYVGRFDPRLLP